MSTETVATYDFDMDAMGLGDFISQQMDAIPEDASPVVYVTDETGRAAVKAVWRRDTLTDGSVAFELIISFAD